MDSDLIYAKTSAGEHAMLHRTQVTQRSLRTVLILVDGQSSVAELCARTGNREQTEQALAELEKGGFIELQVEQDSLWIESKKVEEEIRAAASNNPHPLSPVQRDVSSRLPPVAGASAEFSTPGQAAGQEGVAAARQGGQDSTLRSKPPLEDRRVFVHSGPQGAMSSEFSISQYSFPPMVVGRTSAAATAGVSAKKGFAERLAAGWQAMISFPSRARAALTRTRSRPTLAAEPAPTLRRVRRRGSLLGNLALTLLIVIALLSLTLIFFPYEQYLPELEAALTQVAGRPVKVGSMRVSAYPVPVLALEKVSVGEGEEALHVDAVRLEPEITTLTAPRKRFRKVTLSGVTFSAQSIAGLAALASSSARPESFADAASIVLEKAEVAFGGSVFSDLQGKAELGDQGRLHSLRLASADRALEVVLVPADGRIDFSVEAIAWRPVKESPFFFDSLNLKGEFDRRLLTIRAMDLRLFGGVVNGTSVFSAEKSPAVSGEVWFERLDAERLLAATGIGNKLTGDVGGQLHFRATAESWPTLLAALNAEGDFAVHRGSLRGIDLAEAARRISRAPVQGGVTPFERLTGNLKLTAVDYQLSGLVIDSGLIQTTGRVQVGKDRKLSGRMELRMRGSVNQTTVPISLGGSLQDTVVQVSR